MALCSGELPKYVIDTSMIGVRKIRKTLANIAEIFREFFRSSDHFPVFHIAHSMRLDVIEKQSKINGVLLAALFFRDGLESVSRFFARLLGSFVVYFLKCGDEPLVKIAESLLIQRLEGAAIECFAVFGSPKIGDDLLEDANALAAPAIPCEDGREKNHRKSWIWYDKVYSSFSFFANLHTRLPDMFLRIEDMSACAWAQCSL